MSAFLQTLLMLAAVASFCVFLARFCKVPSGLSPLLVLSGTMVFGTVAGMLGLLWAGVILYLLLAVAALAACVFVRLWQPHGFSAPNDTHPRFLSPAFLLFLLSAMGLLLLLSVRKPVFSEWDEFSFWGTAAKITSESNTLYTEAAFGWPWAASQKPGFLILSYWFNFLGDFAPWRVYFAYDLFMLSAFCAAVGCLRLQKWHIAVPVFLTAAVLPFLNVYTRMIYFTTPYLTAYADIPMGITMGGAFAFYFHAIKRREKGLLFGLCFVLAAVTLCKDTGLPLALLAAAVIGVDLFLNEKNAEFQIGKRGKLRGIWAKSAIVTAMIATVAACFIGWSRYLGTLGVAQGSVGGEGEMSQVQMLLNGVLLLFGQTPLASGVAFTEKFSAVFTNMADAFLHSRITLLGTGVSVLGVVFAVLLASFFLSDDAKHRRRVAVFGVFGTLSFLPYYIFIGFTYAFVFKGEQGIGLVDYNRYVGCYYVALLLGALALFCTGTQTATRRLSFARGALLCTLGMAVPMASFLLQMLAGDRRFTDLYVPLGIFVFLACAAFYSHWKDASGLSALALCGVFAMLFGAYVPKHLCVIDYPESVYDDAHLAQASADAIGSQMKTPSTLFFVSQDDTSGEKWFAYSYYLYPHVLRYSWGGGEFFDESAFDGDSERNVSLPQFAAYLYESDCAYLYLQNASDAFLASYGVLFEDKQPASGLYQIERRPGASIEALVPQNGELTQAPDALTPSETIPILKNPAAFLTLTLVYAEVAP